MNGIYKNVTEALPALAHNIMNGSGVEVASRGGSRTVEILHPQVTLTKPWQREVLTPGRKANIAAQIAETMWVLAGRNDIEWLSHYLPRAKDFSDDGKTWRAGYGPRLRRWHGHYADPNYVFDPLKEVINLLKRDQMSRRAVISLWDPALDYDDGTKDIPCNNWLHFINRNGRLHLQVAIRSNDLIWGWSGINTFEWSALQEIVAKALGLAVGELVFNIGSLHVYDHHWVKASRLAEARVGRDRGLEDSPRFAPSSEIALDDLLDRWFNMEELIRNGEPHPPVELFPEPMFRSWLQILQWYWSGGDAAYLKPLAGTRLASAALMTPMSVLPKFRGVLDSVNQPELGEKIDFVKYAKELHEGKDKAYGDSWIRRGEMLGVLANLARKVDRLGVNGGGDTELDTATDLLLYLCKYRVWLDTGEKTGPYHRSQVGNQLDAAKRTREGNRQKTLEDKLRVGLNNLEKIVTDGTDGLAKRIQVQGMIVDAFDLAAMLYWKQGNATRSWNPEAGQ